MNLQYTMYIVNRSYTVNRPVYIKCPLDAVVAHMFLHEDFGVARAAWRRGAQASSACFGMASVRGAWQAARSGCARSFVGCHLTRAHRTHRRAHRFGPVYPSCRSTILSILSSTSSIKYHTIQTESISSPWPRHIQ